MKFSLKSIAAAVVMAAAAAGANAAIDTGVGGNGELMFNIWDANGSYTFDLNKTISVFEGDVNAAGALNQTFALSNFGSFLAGVQNTSLLKFNVVAVDSAGTARSFLTTFNPLTVNNPTNTNDVMRSLATTSNAFITKVNTVIGSSNNVAVDSTSPAYAGQADFGDNPAGFLNFSNAGTVANNSYSNGMSFMRADFRSSGVANSFYVPYADQGNAVRVWIDGNNLNIAAVPEPESYAMLLAGLGMIGFMARRRNKRA